MQSVLVGGSDNVNNINPLRLALLSADSIAYQSILSLLTASMPMTFNETNFDRVRGNTAKSIFPLAARTAGSFASGIPNYNARGAKFVVDVTAASGTGGLTVLIQLEDALSGKLITLLQSALITTISTVVLTVYPGVAAVANVSANDVLPRGFRVTVTAGDGSSYTYSISANFVL